MNSQGTPLYITYKPRLYGRKHHAKLIVQVSTSKVNLLLVRHYVSRAKHKVVMILQLTQSETNEWCYDIVGMVPTLSSPWT